MSDINKDSLKNYIELLNEKRKNAELRKFVNAKDMEVKQLKREKENNFESSINQRTKIIYKEANEKNEKLSNENKLLEKRALLAEDLNERLKKDNNGLKATIDELSNKIEDLQDEVASLKKEIERLKVIQNNDGTTCGIPTSQTPINKNKVIPNSRVKSGKTIGGQNGHKKHKLEKFKDEEVTIVNEEILEQCTNCSSEDLVPTGKVIEKDLYEYRMIVDKIRYKYIEYKCSQCGKIVHKLIPDNLKEENQYGSSIQALAVSLMNIANVPVNKTKRIIEGLTINEISPSEGYLSKLQARASKKLEDFNKDLRKHVIELTKVHWDDTVIMVNKKRACMRFYGDEKCALYKAHNHKDKKGLDDDNILNLLDENTIVVHDHNTINYNEDYIFVNVECNVHLLRDLEKVCTNLPTRTWAKSLKKLINEYNESKKELEIKKVHSFSDEEINRYFIEFDKAILLGYQENEEDGKSYYCEKEKALLNRLVKYRDNYTYWILDFDIPFDNNLGERGLRNTKSKMKVSGQFKNITYAEYYANIRTYIETCYRNGINEVEALTRLFNDNPYTVAEIFQKEN